MYKLNNKALQNKKKFKKKFNVLKEFDSNLIKCLWFLNFNW